MKPLRLIFSFILVVNLSMGIASTGARADDELPPPQDMTGGADPVQEAPPTQETPPSLELPTTDADSLPNLGGQEDLPAPSIGDGKDDPANQVNNGMQAEDNIFLPTPAVQDNANFSAPMDPAYTNYNNSAQNYENNDWRSGLNARPNFGLYLGLAQRGFISSNIGNSSSRTGPNIGASYRLFDLGQTVFLHVYADYMNFKVGDVVTTGFAPLSGVNVSSFHAGGILEVGIGRRLSLFGTLLHQNDLLTSDPIALSDGGPGAPTKDYYQNIAEPPQWKLGLGIQYDFYVIPHGSIGVRGHVEQDIATVTLSFSIEPVPRKRLTL